MTYNIGGIIFEKDIPLEEVEKQLRSKQQFREFANKTFKTKSKSAQDFIDED